MYRLNTFSCIGNGKGAYGRSPPSGHVWLAGGSRNLAEETPPTATSATDTAAP